MTPQTDQHYLFSDLHLAHARILEHDKRPFPDIMTHDGALTWACVDAGRPNRTLWLLGDIAQTREALVRFVEAIKPHWGKVILIRGNHDDRAAWRHRDMFDEAHEARYVRISKDLKMYLSHYAHRTWRNSQHGSYHFHGHSHGALPRLGRSMDVGAPCVGYKPICLTACIEQLKDQPTTNHH